MKKTLSYFSISILVANIIMLILNLILYRRLNLTYGFIKVEIGSVIIALFITLAILIYKREKGNPTANTIFGFLVILPSLLVIRNLYGIVIFRFSFVLYIVVLVVAILYASIVIFINKQTKMEVQNLNNLLDTEDKDK